MTGVQTCALPIYIMIKSSRMVIEDLVKFGVDFTKDKAGNFIYTKEGAHSVPRILFHEDITGKVITEALIKEVQTRKNIKLIEYLVVAQASRTFPLSRQKVCCDSN